MQALACFMKSELLGRSGRLEWTAAFVLVEDVQIRSEVVDFLPALFSVILYYGL